MDRTTVLSLLTVVILAVLCSLPAAFILSRMRWAPPEAEIRCAPVHIEAAGTLQ